VEAAALCLAGDDLPADDRRLKALLHREDLAARLTLRNDVAAVLRAGTERGWGVALVCGTGMNGMGRARDGRVVRFASLGELSGDAGGGSWLGRQAVRAAVRARDGRDPDTVLRSDVPAALGCKDVAGVLAALHTGALPAGVLAGLAPLVLHAAATGDEVSRGLVETQARELAAMAVSALRRLRLLRAGAEVVLAGGVVRGGGEPFVALVRDAVLAAAPSARVGVLQVAPVAGAALLALDELGLAAAVAPAVRDALADPLSFE
jgi:N-acetylglucosamine kinase-like BadF-type ATPase